MEMNTTTVIPSVNIGGLILNLIWTIVFIVSCFTAGWIIRPRWDKWKEDKKVKKQDQELLPKTFSIDIKEAKKNV